MCFLSKAITKDGQLAKTNSWRETFVFHMKDVGWVQPIGRSKVYRQPLLPEHFNEELQQASNFLCAKCQCFFEIPKCFFRLLLGGGFIFFIFIPIWGRFPFWLIFFRWLKPPTRSWFIALCLPKICFGDAGLKFGGWNVPEKLPEAWYWNITFFNQRF